MHGIAYIDDGILRLSKSPVAELAGVALQARAAAGIEPGGEADVIIIAVPRGAANGIVRDLDARVGELLEATPTP